MTTSTSTNSTTHAAISSSSENELKNNNGNKEVQEKEKDDNSNNDDKDDDRKPAAKDYPLGTTSKNENDDKKDAEDPKEDDDSGSSSSGSGSSSGSSSEEDEDSSDDDEDDDNNNNGDEKAAAASAATTTSEKDNNTDGLSDYEKLRLARIKRNQEYLSKLGLVDESSKIRAKTTTSNKKRRRASTGSQSTIPTERRSIPSRRSKKDVNYTDLTPRWIVNDPKNKTAAGGGGDNDDPATTTVGTTNTNSSDADAATTTAFPQVAGMASPPSYKPGSKRKERSRNHRMDRIIYDEFKRIRSHQKQQLVTCKRYTRHSIRYVKYWQKKCQKWLKQHQRQIQQERYEQQRQLYFEQLRQQQVVERQILGGYTQKELLNDLDQQKHIMFQLVYDYNQEQKAKLLQEQQEMKHREQIRKMQVIDDLDRFPKSMKEAFSSLNTLLYERSPKDPPPPRRSKRSSETITTVTTTPTKQQQHNPPPPKKRRKMNHNDLPMKDEEEGGRPDTTTNEPSSSLSWTPSPTSGGSGGASMGAWSNLNTTSLTLPIATNTSEEVDQAITCGSNDDDGIEKEEDEEETSPTSQSNTANSLSTLKSPPPPPTTTTTAATTTSTAAAATSTATAATTNNKPKPPPRDVARDVGGWISPPFAEDGVDRYWLEKETPPSKFDLMTTYVPQVGDVVLYYPAAHMLFLEEYPDELSLRLKDKSRIPLWHRATREAEAQQKKKKNGTATASSLSSSPSKKAITTTTDTTTMSTTTIHNTTTKTKTNTTKAPWWNNDWLKGLDHSNVGNYPIICRVERTHAEFPPDPYSKHKRTIGTAAVVSDNSTNNNNDKKKKSSSSSKAVRNNNSKTSKSSTNSSKNCDDNDHAVVDKQKTKKSTSTTKMIKNNNNSKTSKATKISNNKSCDNDDAVVDNKKKKSSFSKTVKNNNNSKTSKATNSNKNCDNNDVIDNNNNNKKKKKPSASETVKNNKNSTTSKATNSNKSCGNNDDAVEVVTWEREFPKKKKSLKTKGEVKIRLAVLLRPLTPLLPPTLDSSSSSSSSSQDLQLPPNFSVVTFPSKDVEPFLIPFSWAYCLYHSLSVGDPVMSRVALSVTNSSSSSQTNTRVGGGDDDDTGGSSWKGQVVGFDTIRVGQEKQNDNEHHNDEEDEKKEMEEPEDKDPTTEEEHTNPPKSFGSFRLEDKLENLYGILDQLQRDLQSGSSNRQAVEQLLTAEPSISGMSTTGTRFKAGPTNKSSITSTILFPDACRVIEFWTQFRDRERNSMASSSSSSTLKTTAAKATSSQRISFWDLIRSTLPVFQGVVIRRDALKRKKELISRWNLSAIMQSNARTASRSTKSNPGIALASTHGLPPISMPGLLEGFPNQIEHALHAKIEFTIGEFLENNPRADIFCPPLTSEEAPGYACAVPIAMYFERILSRLSRPASSKSSSSRRCYYTSVESILGDVQAIADNCVLYNDPQSEVAQWALEVVPLLKRDITDVANRHVKESSARIKAEEERRRFVFTSAESSILDASTSLMHDQNKRSSKTNSNGKSSVSKAGSISEKLNITYKAPLYRGWCQAVSANKEPWVPQCGDSILYSRSLHSNFVKGHYASLSTEQCLLPRFHFTGDEKPESEQKENGENLSPQDEKETRSSPDGMVVSGKPFDSSNSEISGLSDAVRTHWLSGTVVWVKTTFPRMPNKKDGDTFQTPSPILVIGLRLNYDWARSEIFTVSWRPCVFLNLVPKSKTAPSCCEACQLPVTTSFVRPAWVAMDPQVAPGTDKILPQTGPSPNSPNGLPEVMADSIRRCLELLKRRCLGDRPVDFVDIALCEENAKHETPLTHTSGPRSVPSFEDVLQRTAAIADSRVLPARAKKSVTTRGVGGVRGVPDETITKQLSEIHFLPPWCESSLSHLLSAETSSHQQPKGPLPPHETLLPFPNLCLEFILLRLANGFYRQLAAVRNDIMEAYVTSLFFALSEPASRKINPLQIRKLTKYLASSKGDSGSASSFPSPDQSGIDRSSKKSGTKKAAKRKLGTAGLGTEDATGAAKSKEAAKKSTAPGQVKSASSTMSLTEEQKKWASRIDGIRRLYATALVCVSDTPQVERIFGLAGKKNETRQIVSSQEDLVRAAAIDRVKVVLNAIGHDRCLNRILPYAVRGLKITCGGEVVPRESPAAPGSIPSVNRVFFSFENCTTNDSLARILYGRHGYRYPCARCQVHGLSYFNCRVRIGHSNPDFNFALNFSGVGGVRGLLSPLTANQMGGSSNEAAPPTPPSNMTPTPQGTITNGTSTEHSARVGDIPNRSSQPNPPPKENATVDDEDKDPREVLKKAQLAWSVANRLESQAQILLDSPARLSDIFIQTSFPFDRNDNHYIYCIHCGLSGDLLCCDGCPNVLHPSCAGISEIPEGDWFCKVCSAAKPTGAMPDNAELKNSEGDGSASVNPSSADAPAASTLSASGPPGQHPGGQPTPHGSGNSLQLKSQPESYPVSEEVFEREVAELAVMLGELETISAKPKRPTSVQGEGNEQGVMANQNSEGKPTTEASDKGAGDVDTKVDSGTEEKDVDTTQEVEPRDSGNSPNKIDQENLSSSENEEKPFPIPLGTAMMKTFGDLGDFRGKVVVVPKEGKTPYYRVRYDDGDEEDMSESELLDSLPLSESRKYSRRKKRGRPKTSNTAQPKTAPRPKNNKESKRSKTASLVSSQTTKSTISSESNKQKVPKRRGRPPKKGTEGSSRALMSSPKEEDKPRERPGKRASRSPKRFIDDPIQKTTYRNS